jgi:hypothetical protein
LAETWRVVSQTTIRILRMKSVNRSAIMVKPKIPYIEWANFLDADGPKLDIEKPYDEYTVYLVDEIGYPRDIDKLINKHYLEIFEYELFAWHTRQEDWPQKRDLQTFREWFSVDAHSEVIDLSTYAFKIEPFFE